MGRATGKPKNQYDDIDLSKVPSGLLDMFAAAVRGATTGALGLPGDLEALTRMGIGWATDSEPSDTVMRTTEDWGKILPPIHYLSADGDVEKSPFETLGEFTAPGIYGKGASALIKGGKYAARKATSGTMNPMRRNFMKAGAALTAAGVAGKYLKHAEDFAKPAAKATDVKPAAVKQAAKTAKLHDIESLSDYKRFLDEEADIAYGENFGSGTGMSDEFADTWKHDFKRELAKTHEQTYYKDKYRKPGEEPTPWGVKFDEDSRMNVIDYEDAFSPQAKKAVKELKQKAFNDNWNKESYFEAMEWDDIPAALKKDAGKDIHWLDYLDDIE